MRERLNVKSVRQTSSRLIINTREKKILHKQNLTRREGTPSAVSTVINAMFNLSADGNVE